MTAATRNCGQKIRCDGQPDAYIVHIVYNIIIMLYIILYSKCIRNGKRSKIGVVIVAIDVQKMVAYYKIVDLS